VRGTHQGGLQPTGNSRAGRAVVRLKLRPSATVAGSSKGQLMTRLGKMGAAKCVDHWGRVDGAREATHVAQR
jgi:hypothetical protein